MNKVDLRERDGNTLSRKRLLEALGAGALGFLTGAVLSKAQPTPTAKIDSSKVIKLDTIIKTPLAADIVVYRDGDQAVECGSSGEWVLFTFTTYFDAIGTIPAVTLLQR